MSERKLRCVLLDRVYDLWNDPVAQRLFQRIVDLKRVGFGKEYGYGVLPIDTQDLTSLHISVFDERDGDMIPLMTTRMTTLARSRLFNQAFPPLQLCALAAAPYHGSAVQQLIDRCTAEGRNLAYWGLWTIHPEARADPELAAFLNKCLGGLTNHVRHELNTTDNLMGGTLRFKVDRTGRALGFEALELDGAPLPPLEVAHLLGEAVLLMYQSKPSAIALQLMEDVRALWNDRLVYAPEGKISDLPPADAKLMPRPDPNAKVYAPQATSTYLPSLLYARERYGALPEVPADQYRNYLKALMAIVGSDGTISENEWKAILELVRKLGLHEKVVGEIQRFDFRSADLAELMKPLGGSSLARRMLYDAARIANEDGLGQRETAAIHLAAEKLDVPRAVVDSIVSLVCDEAENDAIRAAELFPERQQAEPQVSQEGRILVGGNLLDMLSRGDRARLFALGRPRVVEAGEEVVRQGSLGECLFVVEEGELAVVRCLPGDEEEVLAVARPGMLLGELAVLDGGARAASLRARRRSVLREIGLGAFEALTLYGADAGHRILRAVAASVHERLDTTRRLAAAGIGSPAPEAAAGAALEWSAPNDRLFGVLRMLPAFGSITRAEWEAMMPKLGLGNVPRGADLILPEATQPSVIVVLRGSLSPWLDQGRGPEASMPAVGPGGFVDYAAALGFESQPHHWRTRSPAQLLRMDRELFDPRAAAAARLLYSLSRGLATRLRRTTGLAMHFRMANFRSAWDAAERRRTNNPERQPTTA